MPSKDRRKRHNDRKLQQNGAKCIKLTSLFSKKDNNPNAESITTSTECNNSQELTSVSQLCEMNLILQSPSLNSSVESREYSLVEIAKEQDGNNFDKSSSVPVTAVITDFDSHTEDSSSKEEFNSFAPVTEKMDTNSEDSSKQECNSDITAPESLKLKSNKHKTTFDSKWMEKFPWLIHSIKDNRSVLHCSLCMKYKKNSESPWVQNGCISIRLDKIKDHKKSAAHMASVVEEANASHNVFNEENQVQDSKEFKATEAAMKTLHFLVEHNLPHTTIFEPLINFCIDILDCSVLKPLRKAKNATYTSYVSANEFLNAMATVKEKETLAAVKKSPYFSVLADETADVNNRKMMTVAVSYLKDGEQKTSFVKNVYLSDGKAETIFSELSPIINECGSISKMAAFVSDGASAMVGKNEGVATKLKAQNPKIITMNCMNHRLALATKDSFESQKRFLKVDEMLSSTYKYYKYSSVRKNSLMNAQTLFAAEKGKTIKRVGFTRWLSHNEALNSIRSNYEAILVDLENAVVKGGSSNLAGPDPKSLLKMYQNYEFFQAVHFLCDVLEIITNLNLSLQRRNSDLSSIEAHVNTTLTELQKLKKKPGGTYCKKLEERARKLKIIAPIGGTNGSFEEDARLFLDTLYQNVSKRLENLDVISNLGILDLSKVPEEADFTLYGNTKIMELAEYFNAEESILMKEWEEFKAFYLTKTDIPRNALTIQKLVLLMDKVKMSIGDKFPLLHQLINTACVLPVSNAEVERIFSQIKLVLTDNRNRLKVEQVDKLMLLKLNGECDYKMAIEEWRSVKKRRLFD